MARWRCPLCAGDVDRPVATVGGRRYARCDSCTLISLDPAQLPTPQVEEVRYREHINQLDDERYAAFLDRLGAPVRQRLTPGARGLDLGCGTAPLLARIMSEAGFPCAAYDPLFHNAPALLDRRYDYVVCSEVLEHVHAPGRLLDLFAQLLGDGGLLGVMTRFYGLEAPFHRWWYRRDPTHVSFFAASTMRWIARTRGWELEMEVPHLAYFRLPAR